MKCYMLNGNTIFGFNQTVHLYFLGGFFLMAINVHSAKVTLTQFLINPYSLSNQPQPGTGYKLQTT